MAAVSRCHSESVAGWRAQGLLESSWDTDGASPRRYYWLSPEGKRVLETMSETWRRQVRVMDSLLD
ncbi:hypothetical protein GCM10010112_54740 [Actinoplanes lobatus]|uniref:PadR family transcriptional regulator n=1 Tax=Actinoplanes lobatus TaxID=113568 RepID=A0ABQ4AGW3_9ACTN|nr:hypothetical protein GCM10010112_54740 [Actinoplanes lobatus]GIE40247.1 hypothetical protein Alo02nite_31450 [Actinoplanes lobatus]